jgi:5-methylcytosine-specific restriction endonuclease McrA
MDMEEDALNIHHINPISKGGKKADIKNLTLMHKSCHYEAHHPTKEKKPEIKGKKKSKIKKKE